MKNFIFNSESNEYNSFVKMKVSFQYNMLKEATAIQLLLLLIPSPSGSINDSPKIKNQGISDAFCIILERRFKT